MEYQFITDPISGDAQAKCSLEHEAFGYWLTLEIGTDIEKLTQVLSALVDVETKKKSEVLLTGKEYSLTVSLGEVVVQRNEVLDEQTSLPEMLTDENIDFDQYDQASCGSEDFRVMLLAWAKFVGK